MAANPRRLVMVWPQAKSSYERWIGSEGVPVLGGMVVPDVCRIPLRYWKRLGCDSAYLQLKGLQGITGAYVGNLRQALQLNRKNTSMRRSSIFSKVRAWPKFNNATVCRKLLPGKPVACLHRRSTRHIG